MLTATVVQDILLLAKARQSPSLFPQPIARHPILLPQSQALASRCRTERVSEGQLYSECANETSQTGTQTSIRFRLVRPSRCKARGPKIKGEVRGRRETAACG